MNNSVKMSVTLLVYLQTRYLLYCCVCFINLHCADCVCLYSMDLVSVKKNLNPAQVTSAQFGQTVLLLKFKTSKGSRRKLVLSVAAFFRRSFGQFYRNLHKFCSFRWGTKICPN